MSKRIRDEDDVEVEDVDDKEEQEVKSFKVQIMYWPYHHDDLECYEDCDYHHSGEAYFVLDMIKRQLYHCFRHATDNECHTINYRLVPLKHHPTDFIKQLTTDEDGVLVEPKQDATDVVLNSVDLNQPMVIATLKELSFFIHFKLCCVNKRGMNIQSRLVATFDDLFHAFLTNEDGSQCPFPFIRITC